MKVEMQSGSSDFEDLDDANRFRRSSVFEQRKNLWTNQNRNVPNSSSSGFFSGKQSKPSEEDFEFVITKSKNAMKVKRPNVEYNDNYRRLNNGLGSRGSQSFNFNRSSDTKFEKPRDHNRKPKVYKPVPHPGLERNINFDPFDSTSEESDQNNQPYNFRRYSTGENLNEYSKVKQDKYMEKNNRLYTRQKGDSFEDEDFVPTNMVQADYSPNSKYRPGCNKIFRKIKFFFKAVGFKIKKCLTKSKTYLSRIIKNRKQRRRRRKARERLLPNQEYLGEYAGDEELKSISSNRSSRSNRSNKSPTVFRKKIDMPFNTNSNSTSSFEELETKKPKKKPRFPGFKSKEYKRSKFPDPKRTMHHVKLHSFPDG